MGQPARQHRRKFGEEASDQVGEKDHKDACYCVDVIFSVLFAIVHLYLYHKLLR